MSERMIVNRVKKLKALEAQQKEIEAQIEALKDEIKADMQERGVEQQVAGDFLIRWTTVVSSRFDSKTFQEGTCGHVQPLPETDGEPPLLNRIKKEPLPE